MNLDFPVGVQGDFQRRLRFDESCAVIAAAEKTTGKSCSSQRRCERRIIVLLIASFFVQVIGHVFSVKIAGTADRLQCFQYIFTVQLERQNRMFFGGLAIDFSKFKGRKISFFRDFLQLIFYRVDCVAVNGRKVNRIWRIC